MGNVMAASSTPSSAAASLDKAAKSGVPAPPTAPAGLAAVDAPAVDVKLENPGTLEELHKKCKGMSCKRGAKLIARYGGYCFLAADDITYNMCRKYFIMEL